MSHVCFKDDHINLFIGKSLLYFHPFSSVSTLLFFFISSVLTANTSTFFTTFQSQPKAITILFNATWSLTIAFFSNHIAFSLSLLGESKWIFGNNFINGIRSLNVIGFIFTILTETTLDQKTITSWHILPLEKQMQYIFKHILFWQLHPAYFDGSLDLNFKEGVSIHNGRNLVSDLDVLWWSWLSFLEGVDIFCLFYSFSSF